MFKSPRIYFESVLSTEKSVSHRNVGFRALDNTILSYEQTRKGFGNFYCKRRVKNDGIHTHPLELTLSPLVDYNLCLFHRDFHPLSHTFPCQLEKNAYVFMSAEHLFTYEKSIFHNSDKAWCILESNSNSENRQLSSTIKIKSSWYKHCESVMKSILF